MASACKQHLLETGKTTSIRDLYYMTKHTIRNSSENTFDDQVESDPIIEDPEAALECLEEMGFERRADGSVGVADRFVRVVRAGAADGGRPLLNHLALLVDDAHGVQAQAEAGGVQIDDVKDAKNTFAVFLRGPEGVRIEYVEHKPGFALV